MSGLRTISACVLSDDRSIHQAVIADDPDLIVIDAPLSLPHGRATIEDRSGPHLRACDRDLLRMGIRFFPLTLGPMRMLTSRGMTLRSDLVREGFRVMEGYPGGSQDRLGLPRKQAGVAVLQRALVRRGLGGALLARPLTHDELDAVTIAWTGYLYLGGRGLVIGDPKEGLMLLPKTRWRRAGPSPQIPAKRAPRRSVRPSSTRAISARVPG